MKTNKSDLIRLSNFFFIFFLFSPPPSPPPFPPSPFCRSPVRDEGKGEGGGGKKKEEEGKKWERKRKMEYREKCSGNRVTRCGTRANSSNGSFKFFSSVENFESIVIRLIFSFVACLRVFVKRDVSRQE